MIDPQFLAPNGAVSLGAMAIGLLAETFFVLIVTDVTSDSSAVNNERDSGESPFCVLPSGCNLQINFPIFSVKMNRHYLLSL